MKALCPLTTELLREWEVGERKLIGPYSGITTITSELCRFNKLYNRTVGLQSSVRLLVDPETLETVKMWIVERVE